MDQTSNPSFPHVPFHLFSSSLLFSSLLLSSSCHVAFGPSCHINNTGYNPTLKTGYISRAPVVAIHPQTSRQSTDVRPPSTHATANASPETIDIPRFVREATQVDTHSSLVRFCLDIYFIPGVSHEACMEHYVAELAKRGDLRVQAESGATDTNRLPGTVSRYLNGYKYLYRHVFWWRGDSPEADDFAQIGFEPTEDEEALKGPHLEGEPLEPPLELDPVDIDIFSTQFPGEEALLSTVEETGYVEETSSVEDVMVDLESIATRKYGDLETLRDLREKGHEEEKAS